MITRNFKNYLAMILQAGSPYESCLPITTANGLTLYLVTGPSGFPNSIYYTGTLSAASYGISVGRDGTPPTEWDYNLGDTITSGISISVAQNTRTAGQDGGDPWIEYAVTVTNTGAAAVTVREIGYKQNLYGTLLPGDTSGTTTFGTCLLDRTVLPAPITIAPGDAGVIHYRLKTDATPVKTVGGVEIVSWGYGAAEKVSAMLTAAKQGVIDLHTDAGWCVGDVRYVDLSAFTAGNADIPAQRVPIVISSFREYEGCGNVMQLDFRSTITPSIRMNPTSTNVGGYGATEMYTDTLPAMEAALPAWLRGHLCTFNVKASAGSSSDEILTTPGNKLALRSEIEVFGQLISSKPGEGVQEELYRRGESEYRNKFNHQYWWFRSPGDGSQKFIRATTGGTSSYGAANTFGVAPFMCV